MATAGAFLPYGRHEISDDDIAAVTAVLRSDHLTTGPAVERFEAALGAATGARHVVACSSGTAALHLAAAVAGIGPGTAAIVPAMTFVATANVIRHLGGEVVFADVDPDSGLMEAAHAAAALEGAGETSIAAVLPVHLNGQCADPASLRDLADKHGMAVIEDACHALGASYHAGQSEHRVGACGHADIATFSFHPVKTVAMGEGGAVTTNDGASAEMLRRLRHHGLARARGHDPLLHSNPGHTDMEMPGYNFRASDIHCALGASQLARLDHLVERRRALAARYDALLAPLAPTVRPVARAPDCTPAWHLYAVLIDFAAVEHDRPAVMAALRERGIGTQIHYSPVPLQPYYRDRYGEPDIPGARRYFAQELSLPLFPAMADSDVDRVVAALAEIVR